MIEQKDIPKDWKWETLHDALDFVIGGDWGKDEHYEDSNYSFAYCIRGTEIKKWEEEKGKTASLRKIKVSNLGKRKLIEGDIVVEISGGGPEQPVGRTVFIDKTVLNYKPEIPKICTNFLRLLRPKDYVDGKFLNFYLTFFYYSGEIVKYQGGSNNLRNLKFPDFVKINFPLPTKVTQQVIVSKIEELFSELDKGIEYLRLAQEQLEIYRESILKASFEGIGKREMVSVENCCTQIVDCLHSTAKFSTNGYYCVDTTCIQNGKIIFDKIRYVDEKTYKDRISRSKPTEGDILFAREGTVGTTLIVPNNIELCLGQRMMMFRLKKEISPKYFMYYFQSYFFKNQYRPLIMGTTAPHLNIRDIRKFNVIVCSGEEQQKIIEKIETHLSVNDKMQETIKQSLHQAKGLKESILKMAFTGLLT